MAANEYYHDSYASRMSPPAQQHGVYRANSTATSAYSQPHSQPPPYASQPSLNRPPVAPNPSPFETVFDDHVYPANSHPSSANMSQNSFAQDTRYYGHGGNEVPSPTDDIPLRDQNKFTGAGMESTDHVYDVANPNPEAGQSKPKKKGRIRFGELGMLGSEKRRIPFCVYFFSIVQLAVFIGELVKMSQLTGTPIQTQPYFNPMIGPSQQVLINMGSRYVPCMHNVYGIQNQTITFGFSCPNSTSSDASDPSNQCTLSELCGFGGVPNPEFNGDINQSPQPNQWFRFITPMFLHAGIVHIGFNLLLQLTLGKEMERAIGPIRFFLVYISSGIFGFVMGGNFAATGISSTGASGSLFGIIALNLLDLLYSWKDRKNPVRELMFILLDIVISFVLGLLPGLDNFSHIGGFLMGLCLGVCVLHSPNSLRRKMGEDEYTATYQSVGGTGSPHGFPAFFRSPVGFFKGRKPLWWAWWLIRAAALVTVIVVFIVLLNNFYTYHNTCSWCKYLSCLPVNNWCDIGNLQVTTSKRDALPWEQVAKLYA